MPDYAPQVKIDATRAHGAEIVLVGGARSEQARVAAELADERGSSTSRRSTIPT